MSVIKRKNLAKRYLDRSPYRRNPFFKQKIAEGIICIFCDKTVGQKQTMGRKKFWKSLNALHGHLIFDHPNENYKIWLLELTENLIERSNQK